MDGFKITQDMVFPQFSSDYLNVFDYRFAPGRHYYNATRRKAQDIVAIKDEQEFARMTPDAVSCILIVTTPDGEEKLLLTHEFRYPAGRSLLSVPAGLIDKEDLKSDEPVVCAAVREIREETGLVIEPDDSVSVVNPLLFSTPGLTDESNAIVCARVSLDDISLINNSGTEETERIGDYELVTVGKALEYIKNGCDEYGHYYSVFTWIALNFFVNECGAGAHDGGLSSDSAQEPVKKTDEGADSKLQSGCAPVNETGDDPKLRETINRIIDTNDIDYHFQPIISAKTGEVIGYEALMRMPREYGVTPLTLLQYAAEENRLDDVEKATLFNVMERIDGLKDELGNRKVFINSIPGHYLSNAEFRNLADRYRRLFDRIVIEVTEETDVEEKEIELLNSRSSLYGFEVAVDDFGTGYSNVSNLLKILPNYVKIDRFLISELQLDPRKQHFVDTIIQFAHDNGFQALAEGVETLEELNTVIRMGVDLIQGFYTAKPQPTLLQELPQTLLSQISRANLDMVSNNSRQKVYIAKNEKLLSLVDLSLQKYNVLLLTGGDVTLVGNPDFMSAVSIRVSDHADCRLTIRNVSIGDVDDTPCIDLGKESSLILNIEGYNILTGNGICVPESAELVLSGNGILSIKPTFTNAYGIGNDYRYAFGRIVSKMTGMLEINISGENCVCIGGRSSSSPRAIDLRSGAFKSICAASNCVCIGSYEGYTPVYISDMDITIDVRVDNGTMIGAICGRQDTQISNTLMRIFGSGNHVTGIGSSERTEGKVRIRDCNIDIALKGWTVTMIGASGGALSIDVSHCRLMLISEGNTATGVGCREAGSSISIDNVAMDLRINSANGVLLGCCREAFSDGENALEVQRNGFVEDRETWFI
ncbi:MAG: EAL domain-containing protein [Lachnospiraceae bacterium]|nr:EAL domain-containing protein [Lachnospiraceae bacterium]